MAIDEESWKRCEAFHGHVCGGLSIGYQAARYAKELLGAEFSNDEELVCVAENDACGVDAIQVLLGCSIGKGNLLFHFNIPRHTTAITHPFRMCLAFAWFNLDFTF